MRRLPIILFFCLLSLSLMAQQRLERSENYVGVSGGLNLNLMRFNPKLTTGMMLGPEVGVVWRLVTDKHCGLQAELNYAQRGWKESDNDYERRLDYLEVPLLTHLYFGRKVRFTFMLGPKLSFLLGDRHKGDAEPLLDVDQYSIFRHFDYGLCGGPGLEVHGRRSVFFLDARFSYNLGNAFSTKPVDTPYYSASSAWGGAVTLGYLIRTNRD